VNWVLGIDIEKERIVNILTGLGFKIFEQDGDKVVFQVPTHRFDVEQEIDLIEEIARFVGYDNIPEDRSYSIGYRARIRNHGHSCFLCEIVIRSQFHTTYEPEA
jgi:Phenylalanyl-tRNA synthetase beta subunit